MKYWAQTFAYLKKHFWLPLVVMAVPAALACFLSTPYWEVAFVSGFEYNPYVSISETFKIIFGDSWWHAWRVILISGVQIVAASLCISAVDRHLRTGKLSLKTPIRLLNYSIFPIFTAFMVMCLVSIVERFVLFGLVMLVQVIFNAAHLPAAAGLAVISVISALLFFAHVVIIAPMLYWAPVTFVYGYGFRDAAAASFKLLAGQKAKRGIILPLCICAGIQMLFAYLPVHPAVTYTVNFVVFLYTNIHVCVYVVISFYKICKLERRDVMPYENLSLPMPAPVKADNAEVAEQKQNENKQKPKPKKKHGAEDENVH